MEQQENNNNMKQQANIKQQQEERRMKQIIALTVELDNDDVDHFPPIARAVAIAIENRIAQSSGHGWTIGFTTDKADEIRLVGVDTILETKRFIVTLYSGKLEGKALYIEAVDEQIAMWKVEKLMDMKWLKTKKGWFLIAEEYADQVDFDELTNCYSVAIGEIDHEGFSPEAVQW